MSNGKPISIDLANELIKNYADIKAVNISDLATSQVTLQPSQKIGEQAVQIYKDTANTFIFDRYLVERFFHDPAYQTAQYLVVLTGVTNKDDKGDPIVAKPTAILAACETVKDDTTIKKLKVLSRKDIALDEHPPIKTVSELKVNFLGEEELILVFDDNS